MKKITPFSLILIGLFCWLSPAYAHNQVVVIPLRGSTESTSSSIVGSWGSGIYPSGLEFTGEPELISLTFYPNGTYIHYEGPQASEPCDNGGGVEYGTYTFNATTQQISATPIVDNNGCTGLADNGTGGTYPVSIKGDVLQFEDDGFLFQRVEDDNLQLVGSWGDGYYASGIEGDVNEQYVSLTFYANGFYIHHENVQTPGECDGGGLEYGTFTFNATTQNIVVTALFDGNGDCGLTEYGVGATFPVSVNSDSFQFVGRVLP